MARIRTVKPDFFADEKVSKLKRDVRLMFIGLWVFSDDYGTVRSNPVWIKSNIYPYDEELRVNDVKSWLDALVNARMLEPFTYNGEGFYNIRTFEVHQKVEKKSKPIVPVEEKKRTLSEQSGSIRGVFGEGSVPDIVSSNSKGSISLVQSTDIASEYKSLGKTKKSVVEFIKKRSPEFIQPYVDLWNFFAEEKKMSSVQVVNDTRKKKFMVRIKEPAFNFIEILRKAKESNFLLTGKWFGFDWILENNINYLKVLEGNYDNDKKIETQNGNSESEKYRQEHEKTLQKQREILASE